MPSHGNIFQRCLTGVIAVVLESNAETTAGKAKGQPDSDINWRAFVLFVELVIRRTRTHTPRNVEAVEKSLKRSGK